MSKILANLCRDESGISSVEYALLLAFVAAALMIAAGALSSAVSNKMSCVAHIITTGETTCPQV